MKADKPDITPATRVAELLTAYPQLEKTLICHTPAFAALKNPVLRRTVARVASLQQAAKMAETDFTRLVNTLRKEAGLTPLDEKLPTDATPAPPPACGEPPQAAVAHSIDVRPYIEKGGNPKELVMQQAALLQPGECLEVIAPFTPTPLIGLLQKKGYRVTAFTHEDGTVRTFVLHAS